MQPQDIGLRAHAMGITKQASLSSISGQDGVSQRLFFQDPPYWISDLHVHIYRSYTTYLASK